MALNVEPYEASITTRLLDFFNRRTQWQRWLWSAGVVLTLREVLEASEAVQASILSEASLADLAATAVVLIGRDPGAGDTTKKRVLQESLRSNLRFLGIEWQKIRQLTDEIEGKYLQRWADALNDKSTCPGPERTSRALASHLLDLGFSPDFLHRWWTYKTKYEVGTKCLAEIILEVQQLIKLGTKKYEVLIAFETAPQSASGMPSRWLQAPTVSEWLRSNGFDNALIRQNGGLFLNVEARDSWAAVEAAGEIVNRYAARVRLGTRRQLIPIPFAWIATESRPFSLLPMRRGLDVSALHREDQLYSDGELNIVDAAIELLEPLAMGPSSPAVAGGWAAIESLLSGPEGKERVLAAERMAALVACSFARAELTTLSYKIEKQGAPIAAQIRLCDSNIERARLGAKEIENKKPLTLSEASDRAALMRMEAIIANPQQGLADIKNHVAIAFRRLYRNRNLVLHWGKTDAVALRTSLRTAAPLVGAGIDRIAHAFFVDKIRPLELAARATIRLAAVGSNDGPSIVDLLD